MTNRTPRDFLSEAVRLCGGESAVSALLGFKTAMAVRQWYARGVPAEHVLRLSEMTEWRITPHNLRPDIYPHRGDALPDGMRDAVMTQ